jgi:antitoxin MazE
MKVDIIRIGNSRGIRIPKSVFEQCGFSDAVDREVQGTDLILHNPRKPRQGWEEAFAAASKQGKDIPLDREVPTKFDLEEWEW